MNDARSRALFDRAQTLLPGGVSSPVRAFRAVGGVPYFVARAEGAFVETVDGDRLLDFVQSWGPLILGHAHPGIVGAVCEAASRGTSYGAPHEGEIALAQHVVDLYPGAERVRFTSSGTEATMSAVRLARGVTKRDRIVKFDGCYHGHPDALLVAAGSGAVTFGEPSSAGVPAALAELTSVLPLDDEAALERLFAAHGDEVAAVIVEPVPANNGLLLQRPEWLSKLRALTEQHGALLIFDEVISGFRVALGGAAERYGIEPDLATFGKVIGGGLPVGAFAGRAELFEQLAPNGPVYQAGTLSGNPLAMAAGVAGLEVLRTEAVHERLEELGQRLERAFAERCRGSAVRMVRIGSIFWLSFGEGAPPRQASAIDAGEKERYARFFRGCLERGVALAPSMYEVGFLSMAHTEAHVDRAAVVFAESLAEVDA